MVLVKPQPWSKDAEATVLEFQAFINRTARWYVGCRLPWSSAPRMPIAVRCPLGIVKSLLSIPTFRELREIVSRAGSARR